METGRRAAGTRSSLTQRGKAKLEREKVRQRRQQQWSPRSCKEETTYLLMLMAGGFALSSTWAVAPGSRMVANVKGASTFACDVDVMHLILNLNTRRRRGPRSPIDYTNASTMRQLLGPPWPIVWSSRSLQEAAGLQQAYASWV